MKNFLLTSGGIYQRCRLAVAVARNTWLVVGLLFALNPQAMWAADASGGNQLRTVVKGGVGWLAHEQHELGHWTAQGRYPTAMTALAGLAMLSEGSTPTQGRYASNI